MIYTNRCNFRCPFCHNRQLVLNTDFQPVELEEVMRTISDRKGFIDGVVVTGGEPTIYPALPELLAALKSMGVKIKLDTNGYNPAALDILIGGGLLDYIAMDIKTSLPKYDLAAGIKVEKEKITTSVELIQKSRVKHEFRTTCVPGIVDIQDVEAISVWIGNGEDYTLQQFQPENTLDPECSKITPYLRQTLEEFREIAGRNVASCRLIGV